MPSLSSQDWALYLELVAGEPMAWLAAAALLLALLYGGLSAAGARPWSWAPDALSLRRRPLHVHVVLASIGALTLPIVIVCFGVLLFDVSSRAQQREAELASAALGAARYLEQSIHRRRLRVLALAEGLAAEPPRDRPALESRLVRFLRANPDSSTAIVTDAQGALLAVARREYPDDRVVAYPVASDSVADRDYFVTPMRTGRPYLSHAFRGRGPGQHLIFAIAAPYGVPERRGVVQISVIEDALRTQLRLQVIDRDLAFEVVDPAGTVMAQAADATGAAAADPRFEARATTVDGWQVMLSRGFAADADAALAHFRALFAASTIGGFAAIGLIALLVRRVIKPVGRLARAMIKLDVRDEPQPLRVSRFAPREVRVLFAQFTRAIRRMYRADLELRQVLAEREATIAARTSELAAANEALRELARTDALTGIPNQRAFREQFAYAWGTAQRVQRPLAIVLIDVDWFKLYNDALGHPAGDACLARVAQALTAVGRRSLDVVARYGGEEFVMILPLTDGDLAVELADQARANVEGLRLPHPAAPAGVVTVSAGVATWTPGATSDPAALLAAADAALYSAKREGRNRVVRA